MGELYSRPAKIRKISQRGKGITIPPEASLQPGDEVLLLSDGFVLIVPKGTKVDRELLEKAIQIIEVEDTASKKSD